MAAPGSEFTAIVRVAGPGRLDEFREQLRWLMVRDVDAENYTEHHAGDGLEYRFEIKKGVPFAAFANASEEFPELRVEAEWRNAAQGVRGRAIMMLSGACWTSTATRWSRPSSPAVCGVRRPLGIWA